MSNTTIDTPQQQVYEQPQNENTNNNDNTADSSTNTDNSVFEETSKEEDKASQESPQEAYNKVLKKMADAGIDLTNIHYELGELDFLQYGANLSKEVQNMITDSFDRPEDYALQKEIARMFVGKGNSVWQSNTFISQLYAMGFQVEVSTVETQYATDWKNGKSSHITNGAINIFKISDGKGGEIIIADANGNGAIESEELFMNQILEGITSDFLPAALSPVGYLASQVVSNGGIKGAVDSIYGKVLDGVASISMLTRKKISQSTYNRLVDNYIAQNHCLNVGEAIAQINAKYHCNTNDIQYSGKYQGQRFITTMDAATGAGLDTLAQNEAMNQTLQNVY